MGAFTLVDENRVASAIPEAICLIGREEPFSYCDGSDDPVTTGSAVLLVEDNEAKPAPDQGSVPGRSNNIVEASGLDEARKLLSGMVPSLVLQNIAD